MIIYGAGLAGLLAGHSLRRFSPTIREAQPNLPNNHAALLRFRSDAASRVANIPFKKVWVQKGLVSPGNTGEILTEANLKFSNMYSIKVTGEARLRSIVNLEPVERYIAPPDFIAQMAKSLKIEFGCPMTIASDCISTIPMPTLMDIVNWEKPNFKFNTIWSVTCDIEQPTCELYQTLYYPDLYVPYYRVSITGNHLIIEYNQKPDTPEHDIDKVLGDFFSYKPKRICSEFDVKEQKYGKLLPIENKARKEFILAMTDLYGIYSLGRFATWRQILLDDVVKDVHIIENMFSERDSYKRKLNSIQGD